MPTVLITGAAAGIGRAAALRFAAAGWRCVLVDRQAEALDALLPLLSPATDGAHERRVVDLIDPVARAGLAALAGPIDAVVNNAGMSDTSGTPLVEQSPAAQARLVALNLEAPAAVVQAVAPRLAPGARIVNVASGAGLRAIPWRGLYSPTKAGVIGLSQALARARPDLGVTTLCPGFVRTELVDSLIAAGRLDPTQAVAKIPLGRMASPDEMAEALLFLASAEARPLSGQVLALDGGSSVFGGSGQGAPTTQPPLPMTTPLAAQLVGVLPGPWAALAAGLPDAAASAPQAYAATIDLTALWAGDVLAAVQTAAQQAAAAQTGPASLTLLLPQRHEGELANGPAALPVGGDVPAIPPAALNAGRDAAARMLVATLACELGARGLRVNALLVDAASPDVAALLPLLRYVGGAQAQFLTGQVLSVGAIAQGYR